MQGARKEMIRMKVDRRDRQDVERKTENRGTISRLSVNFA